MKIIAASLVTAAVAAGGAHAYDAAVTPAQISSLQARVTALEKFQNKCLRAYHIDLTENSNGAMAWGIGAPTPHAGRFYGIPATSAAPFYC